MKHMAAGRRSPGFALMDVMAAVVILGLFIMPLLIARNNTLVTTAETVCLRRARLLAERKMGEIERESKGEPQADAGDFGEDFPGFSWATETETRPLSAVVPAVEPKDEEGLDSGESGEEDEETEDGELDEDDRLVTVLTLRVKYPSPFAESMESAPAPETGEDGAAAAKPGEVVLVRVFVAAKAEEDGLEPPPESEPQPPARELVDLFAPASSAEGGESGEGGDDSDGEGAGEE